MFQVLLFVLFSNIVSSEDFDSFKVATKPTNLKTSCFVIPHVNSYDLTSLLSFASGIM